MRMKIPTTGSGNGYYGHESSLGYISDNSDNSDQAEELDSPTLEDEFSEYMWMEHEEEFDKQILQELEEEALMEHCFEAMLEDEREIRNMPYLNDGEVNGESCTAPWNGRASVNNGNSEQNGVNLCDRMGSLQVHDTNDIAKQSKLNPNAAEFVPQQRPAESKRDENRENSC